MRTNVKKSRPPAPRTHEGAKSVHVSHLAALRRAVMANMLFEGTFYESGEEIAKRIGELTGKVSIDELTRVAIDAREKMKLRHVPLLLARHALYHHKGHKVGDLVAAVIQRPDELAELVAMYRKTSKVKMLPRQLKLGLARAVKKFSDYQLAKYDREGEFRLRDVVFLSHPRTNDAATGVRLAKLVNKSRFPKKTKGGFQVEKQYKLKGKAPGLEVPDTWEVALSEGGDKKAQFTRLLEQNKLGALALLRNLRNMLEAGVDEDLIRTGLERMDTERVLPFRFITAARYAKRLEDALEQAMFRALAEQPKLTGKTALLVDHSKSMDAKVSEKSEVTRFDAAAGLAMILREKADRARIFTFSSTLHEVAPRRGFGIYAALNEVRKPESTMLGAAVRGVYKAFPECDRIIVITDEQSSDRPPAPQGHGYIINVSCNTNGIGYGPWTTVDGWSEAVLEYIRASESNEE